MSGIMGMLLGAGGASLTVTRGSYAEIGKLSTYYCGYDASVGLYVNFGSIAPVPALFNGATVKAVYSYGFAPNEALAYTMIFSGNQAAGFVTGLTINGTSVDGSVGAPSFDATNNETTFSLFANVTGPTLFGLSDGLTSSVSLN
ncbi:MAG: hypothetical protein IPK75_13070 [Acidobacteria bacterium]|jgi:hypothetical protein|nr:hypothetical protein [Acidobacteriota bacterium]